MAQITLKGNPIHTNGQLPEGGVTAPDFKLTKDDMSNVSLSDFKGKNIILNIFPSIDTPVCATSVRKFNAEASNLDNTVVVCVSKDLPFAHKRFCGAEGLANVVSTSDFRFQDFASKYGIEITDGPLAGLMARAVVVIGPDGKVKHSELVPEIAQEPDYEKALGAVRS